MQIDLNELARFLVTAKRRTYAGDGKELTNPQRPDFKELVFEDGLWNYRDSYTGYFMAPGQEVVRFDEKPVWVMSYWGGMLHEFSGDRVLARETFDFLKKALRGVSLDAPFRGPRNFTLENFRYSSSYEGDITDFNGAESIMKDMEFGARTVFRQKFGGGLVIPKS